MIEKTNAKKGEVIERTFGGDTSCINPPKTEYFEVTNELGNNGYYGDKEVKKVSYSDFKKRGTNK
jgi:hypothetical protein